MMMFISTKAFAEFFNLVFTLFLDKYIVFPFIVLHFVSEYATPILIDNKFQKTLVELTFAKQSSLY